jgi:hypothetical protein
MKMEAEEIVGDRLGEAARGRVFPNSRPAIVGIRSRLSGGAERNGGGIYLRSIDNSRPNRLCML